MTAFAGLVLAAVLFKLLGHQWFTPLSVAAAALLLLWRGTLTAPGSRQREAIEGFLLQLGVLIYALSNQDPSYHEHIALALCLVPALPRLRQLGAVAAAEGSVLLLLAYTAWSLAWTSQLSMSVSGVLMSTLCLVFLAALVAWHGGDLRRVFGQVLLVLAALLVGSFVVGGMGHGTAGRTFSGVTLHRNQLGFLLGVMILLCLFMLRERWRAWPALGGLVAAGLLVYIDSKSAIIAVTLALLLFLVISAPHWKRYLGLFVAVLLGLFLALPEPRMDNFALWMGRDPTFTSRTDIWADSLRLAAQQPFTGYGYNAVWSAHENSLSQFPDAPGPRYAHAHNAWIDWVLQLGIGGLLVYVLFLGVLLQRAWALGRSAPAWQAVALVFYIQVYDLANVSTVPLTRFGFFMLAITSLCLWLAPGRAPARQFAGLVGPLPAAGPETGASPRAPGPQRGRQVAAAVAWGVTAFLAMSAYAIWDDGRRYAAADKPGQPAAKGVSDAGYVQPGEFQWKTAEKLLDYQRRHHEGLMQRLQRSEQP
jgi:exopolysaccharide production protein ExoQ